MPLNPSNTLRGVNLPSSQKYGKTSSRPASSGGTRTKTVSSILGGQQPQSASGQLSSQESHWFDKYHKLYEEHMQVKQERKDQDQRLTDITTKFRRITRDLKLQGFNQSDASSAANEVLDPYKREIQILKEKLSAMTAERDHARQEASELRKLLGMRPSGANSNNNTNNRGENSSSNNNNIRGGSLGRSGSGSGGGIVDVTSLLNQRQESSASRNHHHNTSTALVESSGNNGVSQQDLQKLRNALNDEISKNERLSQHNENLRAQLAVASSSTQSGRTPSHHNNNTHNNNINFSTTNTPTRAMSHTNIVHQNESHQNHQGVASSSSSSNNAALQQENRMLRDDVNQLHNRVNEFKNAMDALQSEKSSLEQEIRFLRQNSTNNTGSSTNNGRHHQPQQNNAGLGLGQNINQAGGTTSNNNHQNAFQNHQQSQQNATLSQLSQDLSAQVSHLSQRLDHSQNQVQTLRGECERLLEELKKSHEDVSNARKKTFDSEQEASSLRVKAARNEELESALSLKTTELLRCEQELLRLVDKLQSCSRETESQVRLEYSARLSDVDALRDEAERNRRTKERELFNAQQDLAEAKRELESKKSDNEHLHREIQKLNRQTQELLESKHHEKMQSTRDASDAQLVQQAVTSMMNNNNNSNNNNNTTMNNNNSNNMMNGNQYQGGGYGQQQQQPINGAAGVFDNMGNAASGGNWNEKWELQQLREQAAQAILDREMAEQRASDFEGAVGRKNDLMQEMIEERDQLLYENLELRRRLNGVQTCFTKGPVFINNFDKNTNNTLVRSSTGSNNNASGAPTPFSAVMVTLTAVSITNFGGGSGGLHIASLDGIDGFECGISDPFAVLADGSPTGPSVELPFRFSNIPHDDQTLAQLRESFFNLQLHQVRDGAKSNLVAIARLPAGQSIAACLENGTTSSKIDLLGGDGSHIGSANVGISVDSAALPLALLPPIDARSSAAVRLGFASPSTDPDSMRALLLAMRSVRGVRIQVLRCNNLKNPVDPNRVPTPYVFYTSALERTSDWPLAHIISDTAVHTRTRAVTQNPVFDCEPKDFIFRVFDQQVAAFFRHAKLSFVVYDINCEDPEQNLGMASVSLEPMLKSISSSMIENEVTLGGQGGSISFTISWIR